MYWVWLGVGLVVVLALLGLLSLHMMILMRYFGVVVRVFQERPLFIIPRGKPDPEAEEVTLKSTNDVLLKGCYWQARGPRDQRKGVILFGLEFGSNRWAAAGYTEFLREAGYDIFSFEMRGQGDSPSQHTYQPLQWVTEFEIEDVKAAVDYLKQRPDADPHGIGFFGISKGGSAGLQLACEDHYVRCCVTDGVFATYVVLLPYMKRWIYIYVREWLEWLAPNIPHWYYYYIGEIAIAQVSQDRHCTYAHLEDSIHRLAPRPWLMIHGGADSYISPEMAQNLFDLAGEPKEIWIVDKAKHNQAKEVAGDDYQRRIREFFDRHLPQSPSRG